MKIGKIGFKIALKVANNKVRSRISKTGGKRRNLSRIKRQTIKEGKEIAEEEGENYLKIFKVFKNQSKSLLGVG